MMHTLNVTKILFPFFFLEIITAKTIYCTNKNTVKSTVKLVYNTSFDLKCRWGVCLAKFD